MNFFGENVVALVWSFSNSFSDIPYRISFIKKFACSCPAFRFRQTCKHISTLKDHLKNNSIHTDDKYSISDYGKEILKIK